MSLFVDVDVGPAPVGRERLRRSYSTDVAIVALIFVAATWVGTWVVGAFRQAGGAQYFYQSDFGPAVMCVASTVPITPTYDGRRADADLSETPTVNLAGAQDDVTLFAPTYDWAAGYTRFRGFEFPAGLASCVSNISQVDGLDREPLLLTTTLGGRWREENLYQRLR